MKPQKLGILSAVIASVCCVGPLVLVFLGLGSLGLGAGLSRYHWWFIVAAMALLIVAWRRYLKEAGRCQTAHCEMAGGRRTWAALLLASMVVVVFVGLNLVTYASQSHATRRLTASISHGHLASVVITVEGMTCFTCELTVASSLKRLPGVKEADANVANQTAVVQYDPAQVSVEQLVATITKMGYPAKLPAESASQ